MQIRPLTIGQLGPGQLGPGPKLPRPILEATENYQYDDNGGEECDNDVLVSREIY